MDKILTTSATGLAKLIREGEVTSLEVVKAYIDQAKKVNPLINAIVRDRYELALLEAKDVDERVRAGVDLDLPLLGVPCSIKELFAVKGLPQTGGLQSRRHFLPEKDSTVVARLKAAGAIAIGVTNVSVLALHYESNNKFYGQTNNPYDLSRIPGGSSGGEGAILAAGGAAFGLGTDIGGSIRMPAFFCGIFGHKPGSALVPNTGEFPICEDVRAVLYEGIGPMSRYSEDLMPILKVLAGPDGEDLSVRPSKLGDVDNVKMRDLTFYYINHKNLHEDVKKAQDRAVEELKRSGALVKEIPLGKFEKAFDIFVASLSTVMPNQEIMAILEQGGPKISLVRELVKEVFGRSEYPFYLILNCLIGQLSNTLAKGYAKKYYEIGEEFRQEIDHLLGAKGVLIYPTHPYPAVKHGQGMRYLSRVAFAGIFNILHCPATAIPAGFSGEGLPVGVQVVSRRGNDHLTIAVAKHLEAQGFRWAAPKLSGL